MPAGARRTQARGFTLLELGMVIAVIAVLSTVILMGRGYFDIAKVGTTVELVDSIRRAGRLWSERNRGGVSFAGIDLNAITSGATPLLRPPLQTPWNGAVTLGAANDPDGQPTFMRIDVCTPTDMLGDDLEAQINRFGPVERGNGGCGCETCRVSVTTR